jgi:hypothetical protein
MAMPISGVVAVTWSVSFGEASEDLLLMAECIEEQD